MNPMSFIIFTFSTPPSNSSQLLHFMIRSINKFMYIQRVNYYSVIKINDKTTWRLGEKLNACHDVWRNQNEKLLIKTFSWRKMFSWQAHCSAVCSLSWALCLSPVLPTPSSCSDFGVSDPSFHNQGCVLKPLARFMFWLCGICVQMDACFK